MRDRWISPQATGVIRELFKPSSIFNMEASVGIDGPAHLAGVHGIRAAEDFNMNAPEGFPYFG
jgi:hypothetical protein